MTDLKGQLARLVSNEPEAPYDINHIVRAGRRARRRHNAALAAAGTFGAAGLTAAIVIPVAAMGGGEPSSVTLGVRPSPSPAATTGHCYLVAGSPKALKHNLRQLRVSGRVGADPSTTKVKGDKRDNRTVLEVCPKGTPPMTPGQDGQQDTQPPAGSRYHYTEQPAAIAARLERHLHDRADGFGLSITFTRPFSQESSQLQRGRPSYFSGNVDVHESDGYGDIGVQVTHAVTELVPFTGDCTAAQHCTETKLPDGSVLRTGQVEAGKGDLVITAEVHRPDGVIVQAQQSNYPFGPDAGSQPHGDQPLTLDQLVALATDPAFTF